MVVQIGAKPANVFEDPIGLMTDCHRRIERFLSVLCDVARSAAYRDLTEQERNAAETALHYFEESAPRHIADEEESLFPRLREAPGNEGRGALSQMEGLEHEHRLTEQLHDSLKLVYRRWLSIGTLTEEDASELRSNLNLLQNIYQKHIAIEEDRVFPLARRLVDPVSLETIGQEMARRRE